MRKLRGRYEEKPRKPYQKARHEAGEGDPGRQADTMAVKMPELKVPEKCLHCEHGIARFENVHKGMCKFQYETVIRCDRHPANYRVGCVCAEVYCERR